MGVPFLPGVPALFDYAPVADIAATLLTGDIAGLFTGAFGPQWGIFLDGAPVVVADNVVSFSFKKEWAISDYPIEEGGFETYDKVQIPFDGRFRFSAGGDVSTRQALLDSIDAVAIDKVNLYDIITPEEVYPSVTISHYDYSRTATNGVGLLQVDVWCFNVIVSAGTPFSSTSTPSGAAQVNGGTVQPAAASGGDATSVQTLNATDVAAAGGIP